MNRPRHSVLALFDPLAAPATPTRDPDADKENSTPLSALFARPNSHQPSTPVALPRKRLIDVGDTSLGDASILDLLTEEQEPDSASVPCLETPVPPFQPRTPLAELTLGDANPTPVVRFKAHTSSPLLSSHPMLGDTLLNGHDSLTDNVFDRDTAIPAFNVDGINTPEILVSSCHSVDSQPSQHTIDLDSPSPLPDPPQVDLSLQGDIESASRLYAPNITSHRLSIDLQDTFQIHFQHNSSFDLLNDKISLTEPMESFMADENFDFELERENLRDAMARFKKEFTPSRRRISLRATSDCDSQSQGSNDAMQSSKQSSEAMSDLTSDTDSRSGLDTPRSPTSPGDIHRPSLDFCASPPCVEDRSSKRQSIPSKLPSPTAHRSPIDSFPIPSGEGQSVIPQGKQRRLSTPLITPRRLPSAAPPPAIQALRIVKRTKTHHSKAESADSINLRAGINALPTIHGQERFSMLSKPATAEGIATFSTRTGQSMDRSVLPKSSVAPGTSSTKPGFGPRRVTVSENPIGKTKSNQPSQPTIPGPKRMPISGTGSTIMPPKLSSMATGLKQPTRLESSLPMSSNLPRPSGPTTRTSVSRLPAPSTGQSGTSRLRRPAGCLPRRVIPGE